MLTAYPFFLHGEVVDAEVETAGNAVYFGKLPFFTVSVSVDGAEPSPETPANAVLWPKLPFFTVSVSE